MGKRHFKVVDKFKELANDLKPRLSKTIAGYYEFYAMEDIEFKPIELKVFKGANEELVVKSFEGEKVMIETGFKAYMQENEALELFAPSDLVSLSEPLYVISNSDRGEDEDYNIIIELKNKTHDTVLFKRGEVIAYGAFREVLLADEDNNSKYDAKPINPSVNTFKAPSAAIDHEMSLSLSEFNYVLSGDKTMVVELNNDENKKISVGDVIKFNNTNNIDDFVYCVVTMLDTKRGFRELLVKHGERVFPDADIAVSEMVMLVREKFDIFKEERFGALGIGIKVIEF